jgi:spermidine synthase
MVRIAKDPRLFRFLSSCAPDASIVLGDARLTLAKAGQRHNLIVIDAFSSDSIPVHLLTREAVAGYLSLLENDGVLVMHISNRHMELGRVVAAVGAAEGLVTYLRQDDLRETRRRLQLAAIVRRCLCPALCAT